MNKIATVITHSGSFHCDEVLAYSMIRYLYGNAHVLRTRDDKVIASFAGREDTFVVDVGGIFNPQRRQYDHHQSTFTETFDERSTISLSSSGLVYKYHGDDILKKFLDKRFPSVSYDIIPALKVKMYDGWMKHIDANDVGVSAGNMFAVSSAIYSRVGRMNLNWNHPDKNDPRKIDEAFLRAADIVISEFLDMLWTTVNDHFLSEQIVREAMMTCPSEHTLILPFYCPWKGHVVRLERELGKSFTYVAGPETDDVNGKWRLHTIPTTGFVNRQVIPTHFRKKEGVTFIHNAGFIAAAVSKEVCLSLAQDCMDYFSPKPMASSISGASIPEESNV